MKLKNSWESNSIIKFAAESYVGAGGNPVVLFTEAVEWLYECYEQTGDEICLKAARQMIKVYLEMGLVYDAGRDIFEKILAASGTTFEKEFPARMYTSNVLNNKVNAIRETLGFWPKVREKNYNADWISQDICSKVKNREYGCFCYGKRKQEISFELLILKEDAYLVDLEKKKIYVFEE